MQTNTLHDDEIDGYIDYINRINRPFSSWECLINKELIMVLIPVLMILVLVVLFYVAADFINTHTTISALIGGVTFVAMLAYVLNSHAKKSSAQSEDIRNKLDLDNFLRNLADRYGGHHFELLEIEYIGHETTSCDITIYQRMTNVKFKIYAVLESGDKEIEYSVAFFDLVGRGEVTSAAKKLVSELNPMLPLVRDGGDFVPPVHPVDYF